MRILSFSTADGLDTWGVQVQGGMVERARLADLAPASLQAWIEACAAAPGLAATLQARAATLPPTPLAGLQAAAGAAPAGQDHLPGPELRRPRQGRRQHEGRLPRAVPARRDLAAGARGAAARAQVSTKLDYEAELAVVIGRRARYVTEARGAGVVVRLRLLQRRHAARLPAQDHAVDHRQELRRHRRFRALPGHGRRTAARLRRACASSRA